MTASPTGIRTVQTKFAYLNHMNQVGGFQDRAFTGFPDAMRIGLACNTSQAGGNCRARLRACRKVSCTEMSGLCYWPRHRGNVIQAGRD
jgi:hypothetical protein